MRIEAHKTTNTVEFCIRKNTHNIPTGTIYLYCYLWVEYGVAFASKSIERFLFILQKWTISD